MEYARPRCRTWWKRTREGSSPRAINGPPLNEPTCAAVIIVSGGSIMRKLLPALSVCAAVACAAESDAPKRLQAAADSFKEVMGTPDKSIPQDLLNKAQCIVIVPGLKKGAFIVGAKYGKGFASCRSKDGLGWSAPGAVRVEGGSFGFQIGGEKTDVFMLVMNKRGMDRLLATKFTLGGDATVAAGPVGRSTQAETDAAMTAEILTWSRARGLFAGVALAGATLRAKDP